MSTRSAPKKRRSDGEHRFNLRKKVRESDHSYCESTETFDEDDLSEEPVEVVTSSVTRFKKRLKSQQEKASNNSKFLSSSDETLVLSARKYV